MLVIKRKKGETLKIGDDVEITVVSIDGSGVKLAIEAPRHVTILRKELIEEVRGENKQAAEINLDIIKGIKINLK